MLIDLKPTDSSVGQIGNIIKISFFIFMFISNNTTVPGRTRPDEKDYNVKFFSTTATNREIYHVSPMPQWHIPNKPAQTGRNPETTAI